MRFRKIQRKLDRECKKRDSERKYKRKNYEKKIPRINNYEEKEIGRI